MAGKDQMRASPTTLLTPTTCDPTTPSTIVQEVVDSCWSEVMRGFIHIEQLVINQIKLLE